MNDVNYKKRTLLFLKKLEQLEKELPLPLTELVKKPEIRQIMVDKDEEMIIKETIDRRIRESLQELKGKGRGKKALIETEKTGSIPPIVKINKITQIGKMVTHSIDDSQLTNEESLDKFLTITLSKPKYRSYEYWECFTDSTPVQEVSPQIKITIDKINIEQSIINAINNDIIQEDEKKEIRRVAIDYFFEWKYESKVDIIKTICPTCSKIAFAPKHFKPLKVIKDTDEIKSNSFISMVTSAIETIRTRPKLIFPYLISFTIIFFLSLGKLDLTPLGISINFQSQISGDFITISGERFNINPGALFTLDTLSSFFSFLCTIWFIIILKEFFNSKDSKLKESFKESFQYGRVYLFLFMYIIGLISIILAFILILIVIAFMSPSISYFILVITMMSLPFLFLIIGPLIEIIYALTGIIIVMEDCSIKKGFRKAIKIVHNEFWTIVKLIVFITLLTIGFAFVIVQMSVMDLLNSQILEIAIIVLTGLVLSLLNSTIIGVMYFNSPDKLISHSKAIDSTKAKAYNISGFT